MKRILYILIGLFISLNLQAQTVGIKVAAPIIKNNPSDNTITGYADLLHGGYHITPTKSGRDSLNTSYSKTLKVGMLCYVTGVDSTYRWNGSSWAVQGAGNVTLTQLTDSLKNYTKIADGLISGGTATTNGDSLIVASGVARINSINYNFTGKTFADIPPSGVGKSRILVVYANTTGTLDSIAGSQSNNPVAPVLPSNTVNIVTVTVSNAGIGQISPSGTVNKSLVSNSLNSYNGSNLLYFGWNGSKISSKIDTVDFGINVPMNITGTANSENLQTTTNRGNSTTNNIAIGLTTPLARLHVLSGSVIPSGISDVSTKSGFRFDTANPAISLLLGYDASDNVYIQSANSVTNTTKPLFLNPYGGFIGINNTSPSEQLDVNGYAKATGFKIPSGTSSHFLKADGSVDATSYQSAISFNPIGSTPNANGASISGGVITLQPASASFGGLVTTGNQTLAGQKTLQDTLVTTKGIRNTAMGLGYVGTAVYSADGTMSKIPLAPYVTSGVITKTSNYTVTTTDIGSNGHLLIRGDATAGNITITLPIASTVTGITFIVKKIDSSANTVTISVASTIDGSSTQVLNSQYKLYRITSNGTNYDITGAF